MTKQLKELKKDIIEDIIMRRDCNAMEPEKAKLLIKLIDNAESEFEALTIEAMFTFDRKTGLCFDVRPEKTTDAIKYLKKNEKLSFNQGGKHHTLIVGDSYDALRQLLISHEKAINVIYIDTPYSCDSMDDLANGKYERNITRDNLLSMLKVRLSIAKRLLKPEGVVFLSIDERNYAHVKLMMDGVFNEINYLGTLVWQSSTENNPTQIANEHEYVLCYANHSKYLGKWVAECDAAILIRDKYIEIKDAGITDPKTIQIELRKWIKENKDNLPRVSHYNNVDEKGVYSDSQNSSDTKSGNYTYDIIHPITKLPVSKPKKGWRWPEKTFLEYANSGEVAWGKDETTQPHIKKRIETVTDQLKSIYYEDGRAGTNLLESILEDKELPKNPKPINLIKKLIRYSCPDGGLILDFYAKSGTTGHAILDLKKETGCDYQFIICMSNEKTEINPNGVVEDVTSKRLKRIMTGSCYDGYSGFDWIKKNEAYGDSLDVYDIASVSNKSITAGKTPFDLIDEENYGLSKFATVEEKIKWVCENFEQTQFIIEED